MKKKIKKEITDLLKLIEKTGEFTSNELEVIQDASNKTMDIRNKNIKHYNERINSFIKGEISLEECIYHLKDKNCYNTKIQIDPDKNIVKKLKKISFLEEEERGIHIREPLWLIMFKLLNSLESPKSAHSLLRPIKKLTNKLFNILGICTPIVDRASMVNAVTSRVGTESSILFSKTPAIFNPCEFLESPKNYTQHFAESFNDLDHKTIYVWNEKAIRNQISNDLNTLPNMNSDELKQIYFKHLVKYLSSPKLEIRWGDSSKFVQDSFSLQYISNNYILLRTRKPNKKGYALAIDRSRLINTLKIVGSISGGVIGGSIGGSLGGIFGAVGGLFVYPVLGPKNFYDLKKELVDRYNFQIYKHKPSAADEINRFLNIWFKNL